MIVELFEADRKKILPLIRNSLHQLSIQSAVAGNTPGEVYVDSRDDPRSGLIKTSQCNVIFGNAANREFNEGIKEHIGYFDQIICDEPRWDEVLPKIHGNNALRKYRRKYYKLERSRYAEIAREPSPNGDKPEIRLLYADTIGHIDYKNADIVKDWMVLENPERFGRLSLGALVLVGDTITSCSMIDCISGKKIEIGIKTTKGFRKFGYGKKAVAAMVDESFRNGMQEIGWHCVSTNIGSIKTAKRCGFRLWRLSRTTSTAVFPAKKHGSNCGANWSLSICPIQMINRLLKKLVAFPTTLNIPRI